MTEVRSPNTESQPAVSPARSFVARLLGPRADDRVWRARARGEKEVGHQLSKLGPEWHVLHALEVGARGSDIDHVVIGPPGVLTLNTKCHPRGNAWVVEQMVMVSGQRTDYLSKSRFEASRATQLLSTACGRRVPARAALVFVGLDRLRVKQMPLDVHVTTLRDLRHWLQSLPRAIGPDEIGEIFARARLSSTWQPAALVDY